MIVCDDLLPVLFQDDVKHTLLGDNFPWYYLNDLTGGNRTEKQVRPAYRHQFVVNSMVNSDYVNFLYPIIDAVSNYTGEEYSDILNARAFLQLPLSSNFLGTNDIDTFHVDLESKHKVILYYVLDSDGETVLTDTEFKEGMPVMLDADSEFNIVEKIEPKQGRILCFDGKYFHTAIQPKQNVRCVINIDLAAVA